ncbi:MAG: hypothetical protein ACK4VX_12315 [Polaromonas sp.]
MKLHSRPLFAIFLIAASACHIRAEAQNHPIDPGAAGKSGACPTATQLSAPQIYGQWRVRFTPAPAGLPAEAVMRLERHAEFSESVAGSVLRDLGTARAGGHAPRAQLAGDLENGFLTLDESSNGISITGTWNGELVKESCGKKFTGLWKDTRDNAPPDTPEVPFTMEKVPGW